MARLTPVVKGLGVRRVALVGAGSIGMLTGALIAEQGYDIELFDANPENVAAMNATGARLTGFVDKVVPVTAKLPAEAAGHYDLVLLLTKQLFTEPALAPFVALLSAEGVVCTLQNGTPEDKVSAIVGHDRTIAGNVQFSAKWRGPGETELATALDQMRRFAFEIGELDGQMTERLATVAQLLSAVGTCETTDNISGKKWSKLLLNSTFSGLSAALGCSFGAVMDNPVAARCFVRLLEEGILAGWAHGIRVEGIKGHPATAFTAEHGWGEQRIIEFFTDFIRVSRHGEASMLQDLRKRIPCEIDFINGRVIEVAESHGLDVPFNRLVRSVVTRAEGRGTVPAVDDGERIFAALLEETASTGTD